MRLSDLETLTAAVQEGSLTGAARRLYLTQPAVSARLRRLETEVGEPLLSRSGQGVRPTSAGRLLYLRAQALLDTVRSLEDEIRGEGPLSGRLSVGATDLVAVYHLPGVLRRFRRKHPQLEISLHVEGTAQLLRMLQAGAVELVVATFPVVLEGLETAALYRDPLAVLAHPSHPLARSAGGARRKRGVDPRALAPEIWISHKPESVTRQMVEGFFGRQGLRLRVEMEISSPEVIKKLVQARLGVAALPWCSVRREVADGRLATIAVRGFDLERSSGIILRRGAALSRAAREFRAALGPGSAAG